MRNDSNDNLRLWRQRLREFRKSGLSRRAFCDQSGIKKSSLDYWLARLSKPTKVTGLVEVKPAVPPSPGGRLEVVVGGRYRIEIHGAVDGELFREVVHALESLG
jgi:hypothetical protein